MVGKLDQYRRDLESAGVAQIFRALGRLLLAEPEVELVEVRKRILATVGVNAGLLTATSPELAALLRVPPDAGDALTAQARTQRAAADLLRVVATRERPVVVFMDDLQWAGPTSLGFVDLLVSEPVEGLLLVGAYRDDNLIATHPLAGLLPRWRQLPGLREVRLDNLPPASLADLIADMLHVDSAASADLAAAFGSETTGNPYETVELLDALRRNGVLTASGDGWRWDSALVRRHLGDAEPAALSAARLADLPAATQAVVEAMACLGGRTAASLLQAATGQSPDVIEQALTPAVQDGLLVAEPGAAPAMPVSSRPSA